MSWLYSVGGLKVWNTKPHRLISWEVEVNGSTQSPLSASQIETRGPRRVSSRRRLGLALRLLSRPTYLVVKD